MRTKFELLEIVRDNFDEYFCEGFCLLIEHLRCVGEITYSEEDRLQRIIEYNKPKGMFDKHFFFEPGLKQPRLDLLNRLIEQEKLKIETNETNN